MSDELPNGWSLSSLGQIVTLRGEKVSPVLSPEEPYLGLEDIEPHTARILRYSRAGDFKSAAARFYPGDILYSRLRPYLNKVTLAECYGLASAELLALRAAEGIDKGFLLRRIMAADFLEFTASLDRGDRPRVDYDQISAFPIKLPPSAEQERVGKKIASLFARSSRARSELAHIPKLIDRYRQAVLEAAFRGDLTANWRSNNIEAPGSNLRKNLLADHSECLKRLGKRNAKTFDFAIEEDLPVLPDTWTWMPVAALASSVVDGVHKKPTYHDTGVPFVTVRNLTAGPELTFDGCRYVSEKDHEEFTRRTNPEYGDVLISKDGTLGVVRAVRTHETFSIFVSVALVKPIDRQITDYLELAFQSPQVQRQMIGVGSGLQHIHLVDLRQDMIPVAPARERMEIVRQVRQRLSMLDKVEQEMLAASRLVQRLDQSILDKAFSGQLVPQDPADEPASALLERIQAARAAAPKAKRGRKPKG